MIPRYERELLGQALDEALALAKTGRKLDGYRRLDLGIAWAETAGMVDEPWAEELLRRYRVALVKYAEICGICWGTGTLGLETPAAPSRLHASAEVATRLCLQAEALRRQAADTRGHARYLRERARAARGARPTARRMVSPTPA
jgi:hypothetical protein